MSKITIEIDREKALDLSVWIQQGMFNAIRDDSNIDNMGWVRYWINLASRLEEVKDKQERNGKDKSCNGHNPWKL